ncbi:MAG: hypothetical protein NXH75_09515 [Halobacteriovoraceae bacterium]|nr:hypothetical protein [Halobacteriovoraceae bacterium]
MSFPYFILLLGLLFRSPLAFSFDELDCPKLDKKAENLHIKGDSNGALKLGTEVIDKCPNPSYNIIILMGRLQQTLKKNQLKALDYFEQAIEIGPNYYLAYMNASAVHLNMMRYDEAIKYGELAVQKSKEKDEKLKSKFNLGLALFRKAISEENNKDLLLKGYKLFEETKNLKEAKGISYFNLAFVEENIHLNEEKAKNYFTKSCNAGFSQACQYKEGITQRIALLKNKKKFDGLSSKKLLEKLGTCYKKKFNMTDENVKMTVDSMTSGMAMLNEKQKQHSLGSTLKGMKCD